MEEMEDAPLQHGPFSRGRGGHSVTGASSSIGSLALSSGLESTDPEKIIKVWEGDTYQYVNGRLIKMRACDHKSIQGFRVTEFVPPAEQRRCR